MAQTFPMQYRHNMTPRPLDARWFQVCSLGALLCFSVVRLDFAAGPAQSAVTLASALAWQAACCAVFTIRFDPLSPLVTGLSLSLLLRSHDPAVWVGAPALAIGSKFLLRLRGKHVFNPAAFAIVVLLGCGADVWVSPGQWGARAELGFLLLCLGSVVLTRARRLDTAAAFLATYAGLLVTRALRLGDPLAIPLHQLQSGSLLLFTFFMVTDPRSTPDRRLARTAFAAAVAILGYKLQFDFQVRTGLYWSLACVSLATPLLDVVLPAERFRWKTAEA